MDTSLGPQQPGRGSSRGPSPVRVVRAVLLARRARAGRQGGAGRRGGPEGCGSGGVGVREARPSRAVPAGAAPPAMHAPSPHTQAPAATACPRAARPAVRRRAGSGGSESACGRAGTRAAGSGTAGGLQAGGVCAAQGGPGAGTSLAHRCLGAPRSRAWQAPPQHSLLFGHWHPDRTPKRRDRLAGPHPGPGRRLLAGLGIRHERDWGGRAARLRDSSCTRCLPPPWREVDVTAPLSHVTWPAGHGTWPRPSFRSAVQPQRIVAISATAGRAWLSAHRLSPVATCLTVRCLLRDRRASCEWMHVPHRSESGCASSAMRAMKPSSAEE